MPLNHIDFHRCEIGKRIFRILQCLFGMREAMKFMSDAFITPIVKIIIVQESAANKKVAIDSRSVTLVVLITKVSDLDGVRISARFYVVAKCFHFLEILGMNDALQQMIKFGIDLHKHTFRIFFISLGGRRADYSTQKKTATTEVIAAMKKEKTESAYLIFTEKTLPHFGHLQLCSPLIFLRRICTLQLGHLR